MVTNDERRAAANTIRRYNGQANCMYLVKYAACRGDLDASESAFLNRLADLIDPEPERTCRIDMPVIDWETGETDCRCSSCGFSADPQYWAETYVYCPNCGAKLVEE